jgi:hypothetical protein
VKKIVLSFISLLLLTALTLAQESKRVPQGIREADKAEVAFEKSVPPPRNTIRTSQHLRQDADELAKLAQSVPGDIEQVHQGVLPAGLEGKLKTIEKLSKRLRSGLDPKRELGY